MNCAMDEDLGMYISVFCYIANVNNNHDLLLDRLLFIELILMLTNNPSLNCLAGIQMNLKVHVLLENDNSIKQ